MSDKVSDDELFWMLHKSEEADYEEGAHYRNPQPVSNTTKALRELKAAREMLDGECVWTYHPASFGTPRHWSHACRDKQGKELPIFMYACTTYCGECRKKVKIEGGDAK